MICVSRRVFNLLPLMLCLRSVFPFAFLLFLELIMPPEYRSAASGNLHSLPRQSNVCAGERPYKELKATDVVW